MGPGRLLYSFKASIAASTCSACFSRSSRVIESMLTRARSIAWIMGLVVMACLAVCLIHHDASDAADQVPFSGGLAIRLGFGKTVYGVVMRRSRESRSTALPRVMGQGTSGKVFNWDSLH